LYEVCRDESLKNHVWNKLFRTELFGEIRFPAGMVFEDILTTYKLFQNASRIALLHEAKYYYIQRKGSISATASIGNWLDRLDAHELRYKDLVKTHPELDAVMYKGMLHAGRLLSRRMLRTPKDRYAEDLTRSKSCLLFLGEQARLLKARSDHRIRSPETGQESTPYVAVTNLEVVQGRQLAKCYKPAFVIVLALDVPRVLAKRIHEGKSD
jgi:hypothetical protein